MKNKLTSNKYFNITKRVLQSTIFALLLSVAFSAYEMRTRAEESKEVVMNLTEIQNSLSTRHLGIFPKYVGNINNMLEEAIRQNQIKDRDSVIICEDVLYYGIHSDAKGFRKMISNLITLSDRGCHITMAYYDINRLPFQHMISNSLISNTQQKNYHKDKRLYHEKLLAVKKAHADIPKEKSDREKEAITKAIIDKYFDNYMSKKGVSESYSSLLYRLSNRRFVDSVLCEKYFRATRAENTDKFTKMIDQMSQPLPLYNDTNDRVSIKVNELCAQLNEIKQCYLNKPYDQIRYGDIDKMYKDMTVAIAGMFTSLENVELIPLSENLTMSCWMTTINGEDTAIIAFPSKYSTDEIAFISKDVVFSNYIRTMLTGIKVSQDIE